MRKIILLTLISLNSFANDCIQSCRDDREEDLALSEAILVDTDPQGYAELKAILAARFSQCVHSCKQKREKNEKRN